METVIRLLILLGLVVIVASLGSALLHLSRGGAVDSKKLSRALTLRIAVSLAVFALLIIAWYLGLITPHAIQPATTAVPPR